MPCMFARKHEGVFFMTKSNTIPYLCRYTQIGVASFGPSSGCGEYPAGFTRINPAVLGWIGVVTAGAAGNVPNKC